MSNLCDFKEISMCRSRAITWNTRKYLRLSFLWYQGIFHDVPVVRFSLNLQNSLKTTRQVFCAILKKFLCVGAEVSLETQGNILKLALRYGTKHHI